MPPASVTVRAPATSANLGPGFDCLGLALDLWATATVTVEKGRGALPEDPASQTALAAARRVYKRLGRKSPPLTVAYESDIPPARGLGASAAARAAGLLAANALLGEPLDREDLLALGAELEGHADNMAPCLFGGFQIVVSEEEAGDVRASKERRWLHLGLPLPELKAVLFIPHFAMPTDESRRLLPRSIPRRDAVHNIGRAALLVGALAGGRLELLATATQDRLHQPARAELFPAMYDIFEAAKEAGGHAAYLSGGGSTVAALATGHEERIARLMQQAAVARGYSGRSAITEPSTEGARVMES
ncbi:MAG TPA: homoserine kinase [Dehalococcoidia bacterium]|nr:homoserine kinase [Dehalococcoidia bacterium]